MRRRLPYRSSFHTSGADAVRFRAPSGATVFAAGSIDFALAVDPLSADAAHPYDRRLDRFLRNALRALGGR